VSTTNEGKSPYAGWYAWDDETREWVPHPDPEAGERIPESAMRAPLYVREARKRREGPPMPPRFRRR
jgi:hypothetical protein